VSHCFASLCLYICWCPIAEALPSVSYPVLHLQCAVQELSLNRCTHSAVVPHVSTTFITFMINLQICNCSDTKGTAYMLEKCTRSNCICYSSWAVGQSGCKWLGCHVVGSVAGIHIPAVLHSRQWLSLKYHPCFSFGGSKSVYWFSKTLCAAILTNEGSLI
jgi:hypothetical protein